MRHDPKKPTARRPLIVKKETLRTLDHHRTLDPHELAQVAGGTFYPRRSCACTN